MAWTTEAEMVRDFVASVARIRDQKWTVYPETAGWDLLLVHADGYQVGIEAKLALNAKVIAQSLTGASNYYNAVGPDFRAVLVPDNKIQHSFDTICRALGLCIIPMSEHYFSAATHLPDEGHWWNQLPNWCPSERCRLPDYIPDVEGGKSSPIKLTLWKIKAIKLIIILEHRGFVTRDDMKALEISTTRWTDVWTGLLDRAPERGGFVANHRTPDFRKEHPRNFAEIEADFPVWGKPFLKADLFGEAA